MKRLWIFAIALTVSVTAFAQQEGATAHVILILLAHPDITASKSNASMIESVKDLPYMRIINIYKAPFEAVTEAFREAKHIVFQFLFYWASAPHLLKKWCDEIFGAIRSNPGVKGKTLTVATTTGSDDKPH